MRMRRELHRLSRRLVSRDVRRLAVQGGLGAFLVPMCLIAAACGPTAQESAPSATEKTLPAAPDGRWLVTHVDEVPVEPGEFFLTTSDEKILGGYDGCNSFSKIAGQPGMVESTLQGCGESARMRAYVAVALSQDAEVGMEGDTLVARTSSATLRARPIGDTEQIPTRIADQPGLIPETRSRTTPPPPET